LPFSAFAQLYWSGTILLSSYPVHISEDIILTGDVTLYKSASNDTYFNRSISGDYSITITGSEYTTVVFRPSLGCSTTYTGKTIISTGTLWVSNQSNSYYTGIGSSSELILNGNGVFRGHNLIKNLSSNSTTSRIEPSSWVNIECSKDCSFSGIIANGSSGIWKSGPGKLTLLGNNTYTGPTDVKEGTLQIGNATGTAIASINSTSAVQLTLPSSILLFRPNANSTTFSKVISGEGSVVIDVGTASGRTFTLSNANTYTGTTTIESGKLILSTYGSIASSSSVVLNSNTAKFETGADSKTIKGLNSTYSNAEIIYAGSGLTINNADDCNYMGKFTPYSNGNNLTKTGAGTFTIIGNGTVPGSLRNNGGTLVLDNCSWGSLYLSAGAILTVNGNLTITGNGSTGDAKLFLYGGTINMNLNGATPSKIAVIGNVSATGTNTINIATTSAQSNYVLIQASGGTTSLAPYTLAPVSGFPSANLSINSPTQLLFNTAIVEIPPIITTTTLPNGTISIAYNQTLTATSPTPIIWSLESGNLPNGLTLSTGGIISGTPTTAGTYNFTVKATNSFSYDTKGLSIIVVINPNAPIITTTTLPNGTIDVAYNQTLTATGTTPISWTVISGNLPTNLSLSSAGVISGTPTAVGTFNFTVQATNNLGNNTKALSIIINGVAPVITTTTLPNGVTGTTYNQTLAATGTATITWSVISGNLPNGLNLSGAGVISGTSTAAGIFNFTVQATNSAGNDTKALSITVLEPPTITTTTLPGGVTGTAYSAQLAATGTTPITWSLESGNLPTGFTLSTTGLISGTPSAIGTFTFTVKATNSVGNNTKSLSIAITAAPVAPTITTTTLPAGRTGTAYSAQLEATGTAPITWSLESGSLPNGLSLSGAGLISGTPTAAGTSNFTVKATNSAGSATKALSIIVRTLPTITTTSLPNGKVNTTYSTTLSATGSTPITWDLASGNLPAGLILSTDGKITGTPTAQVTSNFTVRATNAAGSATKVLSLTITAPPKITTTLLPNGSVGTLYNQALTATGTTPITWTYYGPLPTGLTLSSDGKITGTPTAGGKFEFIAEATNSIGKDSKELFIFIDGVGVSENEMSGIRVYPNPTTGELIIDNGQWTIENVEVFDIYGRKQKIIVNYQLSIINSINISHLSAGMYFIKIRTELGEVVRKVVKE